MSWLQILVLGAAVGFGEIFPLSGSCLLYTSDAADD